VSSRPRPVVIVEAKQDLPDPHCRALVDAIAECLALAAARGRRVMAEKAERDAAPMAEQDTLDGQPPV